MRFSISLLLLVLFSCNEEEKPLSAAKIIDKAIENAGGGKYARSEITFDFRDRSYKSTRNCGMYSLERFYKDSLGNNIRDVLDNSGFSRYRNGSLLHLPDSMENKYKNSVNSVHYFVQLPYGLGSPAVNKKLLGQDSIRGKNYHEIKVTFDERGGGEDHQDVYVYWVETENFTVDYLAYSYHVEDGGIRFREAFNPRKINGIRFVDYRNFAPENLDVKLSELDSLFTAGKLKLFSTIETENIEVGMNRGC
jgi:hypothetical protein